MLHEMMESMFEFALTIQTFVKDGWEFKMDYGERRLGINPQLIAKKDDKEIRCYNMNDLETELNYDRFQDFDGKSQFDSKPRST